jgi:excisionase family DNA binding protein
MLTYTNRMGYCSARKWKHQNRWSGRKALPYEDGTLNAPLEAPDVLLMPAVTARLFGITTRTLINWVRGGKLPAQRTVGGQRRYRESDVRALLNELQAA